MRTEQLKRNLDLANFDLKVLYILTSWIQSCDRGLWRQPYVKRGGGDRIACRQEIVK